MSGTSEFICSRCHAPKGEHALGEPCSNNCGGIVIRNPRFRSLRDYTLHFAVAAKCEDDEDARRLADILGASLSEPSDVFRVRASAPRPYSAADFEREEPNDA